MKNAEKGSCGAVEGREKGFFPTTHHVNRFKISTPQPTGYQHVDASESTTTKLGSKKQVYKNLYENRFSLNFQTMKNYRIYQLKKKKKKNPHAIIMSVLIKSWVVANQ